MNKELALSGREDKTRDLLLFSGSNVLAMVRHGEPDLPSSGSFFLGSTDRGLSRQGRKSSPEWRMRGEGDVPATSLVCVDADESANVERVSRPVPAMVRHRRERAGRRVLLFGEGGSRAGVRGLKSG